MIDIDTSSRGSTPRGSTPRGSTKGIGGLRAGRKALATAGSIAGAVRRLAQAIRETPTVVERQHSIRLPAFDSDWLSGTSGASGSWASSEYGNYYATSVSVYAAIKLRAEALGRPALVVSRLTSQGVKIPVGPAHPAQRLLDGVNRWYTKGDLWRATEIYLNLWGSVFWAVERDENGHWEIWPLRPDRMRIIPDAATYIRGFVYQGRNGPVAYTPDEIIWMRYFNPLEEFAGLSPLAPARMAVDMGQDGLRFNRNFLRNSARPDFVVLTNETMTDKEIGDFYDRWDARFKGSTNSHRPAIANFIRDIKTLGFSHRDMDFIQGLRWSLEEVSRAFGVPKPLLSDFERATFSNVNAAERMFWRNTMVPEMQFLEEHLNRVLLPRIGYQGLVATFDLSTIEALKEDETSRLSRDVQLLDRGALTINEVRRSRGFPDVPWGNSASKSPESVGAASDDGVPGMAGNPD